MKNIVYKCVECIWYDTNFYVFVYTLTCLTFAHYSCGVTMDVEWHIVNYKRQYHVGATHTIHLNTLVTCCDDGINNNDWGGGGGSVENIPNKTSANKHFTLRSLSLYVCMSVWMNWYQIYYYWISKHESTLGLCLHSIKRRQKIEKDRKKDSERKIIKSQTVFEDSLFGIVSLTSAYSENSTLSLKYLNDYKVFLIVFTIYTHSTTLDFTI